MRFLYKAVYRTPISHALEKRSSGGLTGGETAALVVGIVGVVLTALTVFKGWECWKTRRDRTVSQSNLPPPAPAITQYFYYYIPASSPAVTVSPGHNIPLQSVTTLPQPVQFHPVPPLPSHGDFRPTPVDTTGAYTSQDEAIPVSE
ncbi:hypothetical protein BDD12DRAFT_803436 [Trichophaea hybrida]|nr:hypothetical protein BDD12DRAFT_803436 [Trichophaea hybrida]